MTTTAAAVRTRAWVEHIMGMPISIHVRAENTARPDIDAAVAAVFADLRRADSVFSTYDPTSDVMRWRAYELELADADPWLRHVWELCARAGEVTGGVFTTELTGPDGSTGWDPTGLVKGWAVDTAVAHLRAIPHLAFSVNAGGDILCGLGRNSDHLARPWRIGIENPHDRSSIAHVVSIVEGAVATSSTAARGAHIVDPRTRRPVHRSGSASVIGPSLMWADVWASAAFVDPDSFDPVGEWARYRLRTIP